MLPYFHHDHHHSTQPAIQSVAYIPLSVSLRPVGMGLTLTSKRLSSLSFTATVSVLSTSFSAWRLTPVLRRSAVVWIFSDRHRNSRKNRRFLSKSIAVIRVALAPRTELCLFVRSNRFVTSGAISLKHYRSALYTPLPLSWFFRGTHMWDYFFYKRCHELKPGEKTLHELPVCLQII